MFRALFVRGNLKHNIAVLMSYFTFYTFLKLKKKDDDDGRFCSLCSEANVM
jgi:hypothetical protein